MTDSNSRQYLNHFLAHQRAWGITLLSIWLLGNLLLLSTTEYMEAQRTGSPLPFWEPFCWQATSIFIIALLIWPIMKVAQRLQTHSIKKQLCGHILLTLPFSIIHVAGMVWLRELWYWLAGSDYQFGDIAYEFLYEYRKDAMTYLMIVVITQSYQFIVRRLQGEAALLAKNEQDEKPLQDKLLVKKLGKEFLIEINTIEWVEAAGNYANLHIGENVYPMRTTMSKLQTQLPSHFCRIHRSRIVNTYFVDHCQAQATGDYLVNMNSGLELGMSRRYKDVFKSLLTE